MKQQTTPKEEAQKIYDSYYIICMKYTEEIQCSLQAKECALNHVDGIMNVGSTSYERHVKWLQIKEAIERL